MQTAIALLMAALLEVSGDALTRMGLRGRPMLLAAGGLTLFVYGVVVNQGRFDFGRLMGAYIAVFFFVSQAIAFAVFPRTPNYKTLARRVPVGTGGAPSLLCRAEVLAHPGPAAMTRI